MAALFDIEEALNALLDSPDTVAAVKGIESGLCSTHLALKVGSFLCSSSSVWEVEIQAYANDLVILVRHI